MSPEILFRTHFVLGYVAWLLGFGVYICPRLKAMDHTCRTPGAYAAWLEALLDNQRQSAAASALPATRDLDTGELLATERRVASAVTEQRDSPRDMGHAGARRSVERTQQTLTRDQLLDLARGRSPAVSDRSIDVHVSRLRHRIEADPKEPELIKTVRSGGYVFTAPVTLNGATQ